MYLHPPLRDKCFFIERTTMYQWPQPVCFRCCKLEGNTRCLMCDPCGQSARAEHL